MAMLFMLCDHLWGTIVPGADWLTCIGRLSFPIFAFMIVEGYFHTKNLKKYVCRLLVFAIISEIPFNLAMGSRIFFPIHQNVLWTFLIAVGLIHWNEKVKEKQVWKKLLVAIASVCIGYVGGIITFVDFYNAGVLTVLVFYFFKDKKWWCYFGQLLCLWYINFEMLGGFSYEVGIFGETHFIARQGIAVLALIPIWLYNGEKGPRTALVQWGSYLFYPLHMLILYGIAYFF